MNRRTYLAALGASTVTFAGCSSLSSGGEMLDLAVFSQVNDPYSVDLTFFEDESSRADARAYDTLLNVEAGGQVILEDVARARRYLVRYSVYRDNSRLTDQDHIHYFPSGDAGDSLSFDIRPLGELTRR